MRTKPARKQTNFVGHTDPIPAGQRADTQNGPVRSEFCLNNNNRLLRSVLKQLDCAAGQAHGSLTRLTLYVEHGNTGRDVGFRCRTANNARNFVPLSRRDWPPKICHWIL